MINIPRKKPNAKRQLPRGLKAVAPPKNPELRRLMEGEDIATNGGGRTTHHQPAQR